MLSKEELSRVAVVLVRARNPNNIGAVARAMHDFGFSDLRLVSDFTVPLEAARSAVDASSVLKSARTYSCLAEAVAGCTLVAGTTAVGSRKLDHRLYALSEAAPLLREELAGADQGRIALLFGSEKTGLSNEDLSHCNWLLTIPMNSPESARHLSMNLGQSVAVCLYELVRDRTLASNQGRTTPAASAAEAERLAELFSEVLEVSEYTRHHPANNNLATVRRLILRMGANRTDAPVWMGVLRQILWKLRC